jgi:hypothetical protein
MVEKMEALLGWLFYLVDVGILSVPLQVLWPHSETIRVPVPIPKGVRNRKGANATKSEQPSGASTIK